MKTITLCAVMLFAAFISNGQKAITLNTGNFKLDPTVVKQCIIASTDGVKLPATGTDKTWDYSGLKGGANTQFKYFSTNYKAFSKKAIHDTAYQEPFGSPYEFYPTNQVFDEDSKGYFFAGDYTPYDYVDAYAGGQPGASPGDNITIAAQANVPTATDYILKFPATYSKTASDNSWSTSYTKTTNFTMTFAALQGWVESGNTFSFDNMQGTVVEHTTVTNTVIGWGDLKIPTSKKGKNNEMGALMVQRSVVTTEYLYFGDVLVPDDIAAAFYATQGGVVSASYTESFYTENDFVPALTLSFGSNTDGSADWSTLAGITYRIDDKDGDCDALLVSNTNPNAYIMNNNGNNFIGFNALPTVNDFTTYPNPVSNGSNLNCRFTKNATANWTLNVTNTLGQVVNTITVSGTGTMNVPIQIDNKMGGLFFVNLLNEKGEKAASSKFMVGKQY